MDAGVFSYIDGNQEIAAEFQSIDGLALSNGCNSFTVLFRLLLGTVRISCPNYDNVFQSKNLLKLGMPENNTEGVYTTLISSFGFEDASGNTVLDYCKIHDTFKSPMANVNSSRIFTQMLHEFSMYFVTEEISSIAAFSFLYRSLESIAYCFPLLYVSNSKDFFGTFETIKGFFNNSQKGELKFFRSFIEKIMYDDSNINASVDIEYEPQTPPALITCLETLQKQDLKATTVSVDQSNFRISMRYKDIISYAIVVRNHFFHALQTERDNFRSNQFDPTDIFSKINKPLANVIAYIFLKIVEKLIP